MNFIGVDIAWGERNPSGLCWLSGAESGAEIQEFAILKTNAEMVEWILSRSAGGCIVAVDGPIICPEGYRNCDRLVAKDFGKYRAAPYPVNQQKASKCIRFAQMLASTGFTTQPPWQRQSTSKAVVEVYPHPAWIRFFQLPCILRYKKGAEEERKHHLHTAVKLLKHSLPIAVPSIRSLKIPQRFLRLAGQNRKQLKETEDLLDALFCAYLAFHYWFWGKSKWEIYGNAREGFILIPNSPLLPTRSNSFVI